MNKTLCLLALALWTAPLGAMEQEPTEVEFTIASCNVLSEAVYQDIPRALIERDYLAPVRQFIKPVVENWPGALTQIPAIIGINALSGYIGDYSSWLQWVFRANRLAEGLTPFEGSWKETWTIASPYLIPYIVSNYIPYFSQFDIPWVDVPTVASWAEWLEKGARNLVVIPPFLMQQKYIPFIFAGKAAIQAAIWKKTQKLKAENFWMPAEKRHKLRIDALENSEILKPEENVAITCLQDAQFDDDLAPGPQTFTGEGRYKATAKSPDICFTFPYVHETQIGIINVQRRTIPLAAMLATIAASIKHPNASKIVHWIVVGDFGVDLDEPATLQTARANLPESAWTDAAANLGATAHTLTAPQRCDALFVTKNITVKSCKFIPDTLGQALSFSSVDHEKSHFSNHLIIRAQLAIQPSIGGGDVHIASPAGDELEILKRALELLKNRLIELANRLGEFQNG